MLLFVTACTNTIEVERVVIKCIGNIVTIDSRVDVISDETARLIVKNNLAYKACITR